MYTGYVTIRDTTTVYCIISSFVNPSSASLQPPSAKKVRGILEHPLVVFPIISVPTFMYIIHV